MSFLKILKNKITSYYAKIKEEANFKISEIEKKRKIEMEKEEERKLFFSSPFCPECGETYTEQEYLDGRTKKKSISFSTHDDNNECYINFMYCKKCNILFGVMSTHTSDCMCFRRSFNLVENQKEVK